MIFIHLLIKIVLLDEHEGSFQLSSIEILCKYKSKFLTCSKVN